MDKESREEIWMVKDTGVGMRDTHEPIIWFDLVGINQGVLIILNWQEAHTFIKSNDIHNVLDLKQMPVVVRCEDRTTRLLRVFK